jgi:hypothetical protein
MQQTYLFPRNKRDPEGLFCARKTLAVAPKSPDEHTVK